MHKCLLEIKVSDLDLKAACGKEMDSLIQHTKHGYDVLNSLNFVLRVNKIYDL